MNGEEVAGHLVDGCRTYPRGTLKGRGFTHELLLFVLHIASMHAFIL